MSEEYNKEGYERLKAFVVDLRSVGKVDVLLDIIQDMKAHAESMSYDDDVIDSHGKSQFYKGIMFDANNLYSTIKAALDDVEGNASDKE